MGLEGLLGDTRGGRLQSRPVEYLVTFLWLCILHLAVEMGSGPDRWLSILGVEGGDLHTLSILSTLS